jgi:hypothetical protein
MPLPYRTIVVRLSSLIVLIITLFILISCTQEVEQDTSGADATCQFATPSITNVVGNSSSANTECPVVN